MRVTAVLMAVTLGAGLLVADDRTVDFDPHTDFSTLRTFAVRDGQVDSPEPELNNALVLTKIADTIRMELTSKGLRETVNNPDVIVDYRISGRVYSEGRGGAISSSEGTLVIDLTKRETKALAWRAVYRDSERNSARLAQRLPGDAKRLLSEYPPKQKGVVGPRPAIAPTPRLSPKAAAAAALDVVQTTRQATDFVGPGAHPGLSISLTGLERAARAVVDDDGRNPSAATRKALAFYEALKGTADYAASISDRNVETADARARARALASTLRALGEM